MMRKVFAGVAGAVMALSALGQAHAITNNYQPDHDHDFVGLMVALDDSGEFLWRCSGSLISPTKFVTAGHCTDEPAVAARVYFQQDAGANYDPATQQDPVSGYPDACLDAAMCHEASTVQDYGFDEFAGFPNTRDAGVVILDTPHTTPSGEYGRLAPVGTLDDLFNARGLKDTTFLASGYGLSYRSPVGVVSFRSRLMGYGKLTNTVSANNGGYNLQTNGNGKDQGGTCSGDSGGPIFYPASSNNIVAVTSFGMNSWCRGVDFSYRIDRQEVQDWIASVQPG
ncbi:MAG TPA: trypsin-like serine protease [Acidimicrobiales bacterium]